MLVVIAIISILIGIGINTFTIAQKKARDVRRKADLATLQKALIAYGLDHNGAYCSTSGTCNTTAQLQTMLVTGGYLSSLPTPPTTASTDVYTFSGNGTDFMVRVPLENTSDPDANKTYPSTTSCSGTPANSYCVGAAN